jgi:hypothetical protein
MRYQWQHLNRQQVGAFSEYFVKMELTMYGFQVYTSEVDNRGIDFVARHENGPFLSVQVKSIRKKGYVFMRKQHFSLSPDLVLILAILNEGQEPRLFLIPSLEWNNPNSLLVERDYIGKKSEPEWGLNLSHKNMELLDQYAFSNMVKKYHKTNLQI